MHGVGSATLAVARNYLHKLLGREYSQEDFEKLCFEFGIELDDVTSQKEMYLREHAKSGPAAAAATGAAGVDKQKLDALSDEVIYKIDTPANRYDLLSAEGMALALKVFLGSMKPQQVLPKVMAPKLAMTVNANVKGVRDYVVCAVLRNIRFTTESYNSFIDFQEKLHSGLARKRTLVSVGTHDLDKVTPPFSYALKPKEGIRFVPLNQTRVLDCAGDGLEAFYKDDKHISKYVPLISHLSSFPCISDAEGKLMSLPPIINSETSKISVDTKNVFIECTAIDLHKAHILVDQMIGAFSMYCAEPFHVEAVEIKYETDGTVATTPSEKLRTMEVDVATVNSRVGITIDAQQCVDFLAKMNLIATKKDDKTVSVTIPATRSDILHPCDLVEDVAIAYGYDNLVKVPTPTHSIASQTPVNKLTHLLRMELASAGYTEMLTFSLCSRDEAFKNLQRVDADVAVHIANPQTVEFQVCRPSLLPGTLKTFQANKSAALPLKLFEVSDVVLFDSKSRTGARNERHFAALHCSTESSSFQDIHGLCEYVMVKIGVPKSTAEGVYPRYNLEEGSDGAFFPGRCMDVILHTAKGEAKKIGHLGVMHPEVLKAYELTYPCSYCEINLEPLI